MQIKLWKDLDRSAHAAQSSRTHLLRQFDEMFNQLLGPSSWAEVDAEFVPAYDIQELDDRFLLSFDIPGVNREDVSIEIEGNRLTVSGERKAEGGRDGATARRGRYGRFEQVFTVPDGVSAEGVEATCKDGVLLLAVQKPAAARPTKIKIGVGSGKGADGKGSFIKTFMGDKKGGAGAAESAQTPAAMTN